MGIIEWSLSFAKIHWFKDDYQFVILSAIQTQPSNMTKILKLFSIEIWLLIMTSILIITSFLIISKKLQGFWISIAILSCYYLYCFIGEIIRFESSFKVFYNILRHLLNQSMRKELRERLLINIWSLMALTITACFSGGILTSVVFREQKNINSFDEMIDSNLTVLTYNNSWIWSQYENVLLWNQPLDERLKRLSPRIKFFQGVFFMMK